MNKFGLRFHHLGLAAKDPDKAKGFLADLNYEMGDTKFDPEQNVHLALCTHAAMPAVEIISPGLSGRTPVDGVLARHGSGLVYHLCYESASLAGTLAAIAASGARVLCVSPRKPAILFGGRCVSFYMIDGFGLIEILEAAA